jgi:hypothetical protein
LLCVAANLITPRKRQHLLDCRDNDLGLSSWIPWPVSTVRRSPRVDRAANSAFILYEASRHLTATFLRATGDPLFAPKQRSEFRRRLPV